MILDERLLHHPAGAAHQDLEEVHLPRRERLGLAVHHHLARLQVEAARERLRLDQQSYAQAQERFRAGVAGSTDVISTSLSLNASRSSLVDALTSFQSARVALVRAEGALQLGASVEAQPRLVAAHARGAPTSEHRPGRLEGHCVRGFILHACDLGLRWTGGKRAIDAIACVLTDETPAYRALTEAAALGPDFAEGRAAFAEKRVAKFASSTRSKMSFPPIDTVASAFAAGFGTSCSNVVNWALRS